METFEQRLIGAARGWLGTRFQHQGRVKAAAGHKGGVDCLGLLIGVAGELGLKGRGGVPLASLDRADYGRLPDGAALAAQLAAELEVVAHTLPGQGMRVGDIALMEWEGNPQHLGIITNYREGFGLLHAYAQARGVVEHALDANWRKRIVAVYRPANA